MRYLFFVFLLFLGAQALGQETQPTTEPSSMPSSAPARGTATTAPTSEAITLSSPVLVPIQRGPEQLVTFLPLAIRRAAFAAQYEIPVAKDRYSLAGSLGMRFGARDPNQSMQLTLGAEAKRWFGKNPQ